MKHTTNSTGNKMKHGVAVTILFFSLQSFSQKQFNILDWKTDVTLNTFLVQKMHTQYDERRKNFEKALLSKQSAALYIGSIRKKFLQLLGDLPQRSSLHAKITGTIQLDGYRIEKIIYESFPHHHVTTNLYIPEGKGPFPAVLFFCGHEDVSKATESYQKTAILFAKNGFVVFVLDPISQSERYQLTDEKGKPLTRGGTTEHTLLNEASNLFGNSIPAYELWDNVRGLDYLVTRKEVDSSKIGCLGNSGGGMQAIYFAAYENRVKIIVPCSFLMSRERALELSGPSDGCSQMPDEGSFLMEMSDYLIAAAPKPVLILAGRYDFIDYTGTLAAFMELKKIYNTLGQPQKLELFIYEDGHGISKPKREAAVTWFRKWFYGDEKPVEEPDFKTLTEKELFCTSTGQVNTEFNDEVNIAEKNLELFNSFANHRDEFSKQKKEIIIKKIRELLKVDNDKKVEVQDAGTVEYKNIIYHKLIIRKVNEIPLPVLAVYPEGLPKKITVWFSETGKNKLADSSVLVQFYLRQGSVVIFCDVRGTGETEDRPELNDPKYYNKEYRNAMLALHIGQPLVGQRVTDILSVLDLIAATKKLAVLPVEINATTGCALPALHAALFRENISELNFYYAIKSFRQILEKPAEKDWYSYIIPGALKFYDIPDLVKIVGAQKVKFID